VKLALQYGREKQSPITKFVHLTYSDQNNRDGIPMFENCCFILALFRTHEMNHVNEGKKKKKKLLFFQILQGDDRGAFPLYLHEYPICRKPKYALLNLFGLHWIRKRYQSILEKTLKDKLSEAISQLLEYCQRKIPFYGSLQALFHVLEESILKTNKVQEEIMLGSITSSREASEYLIASQLLDDELRQKVWAQVQSYWSPHQMVYVGPCQNEWQREKEPVVNLLDYFLTDETKFPSRLKKPCLAHLHTALIVSTPPKQLESPSFFQDQKWCVFEDSASVFHGLQSYKPVDPTAQGFHLFRLMWKENDDLFSFVCQQKELRFSLQEASPQRLLMNFEYAAKDKENPFDLIFFINRHPDLSITTRGKKATVFYQADGLTIQTKQQSFTLTFKIIEGEGNIMGHVMMSNRPAQTAISAENAFVAHDWQIGLRTISRSENFTLQLQLEKGCLQQGP